MREINVEYNGGAPLTQAVQPRENRRFGLRSLIVTAAVSVAAAVLLSYALMALTMPRMLDRMGYARKSDLQSGSQNVTIYSSGEHADVEAVAAKVCPSVVGVVAKYSNDSRNLFFFNTDPRDVTSEGSGIVLSADGYILTNYHIIKNAVSAGNTVAEGCSLSVVLPGDRDRMYDVTVVGYDSGTDIAVLKIDADGLTPAELGDSDGIKLGQQVMAVGNPASADHIGTISAGYISALDLDGSDGSSFSLIRTDAVINSGNSGGALADLNGKVIGVNCLQTSSASSGDSTGAAIPINIAKAAAEKIISNRQPDSRTSDPAPERTDDGAEISGAGKAYLGVKMDMNYTEAVASQSGRPAGARVVEVIEGLAADRAGIRAQDIITAVDGKTLTYGSELSDEIKARSPGDKVVLTVWRGAAFGAEGAGETLEIEVELGRMEDTE